MQTSRSLLRCVARSPFPRAIRPAPPKFIPASLRCYHAPRTSTTPRPSLVLSRLQQRHVQRRLESSSAAPAGKAATSTTAPESRLDRDQVPAYEMTFTCKKCDTRSSHRISKQGYHHGTVLITCPGCKNRHLISDHMKIFSDKPVTLEDIMREKGDLVKRGTLDVEGDVEFWDDGSSTPRSAHFHPPEATKGEEKPRLTEQPPSEGNVSSGSDRAT